MSKRKVENEDLYEQYFNQYFNVDYDVWYPYAKGFLNERCNFNQSSMNCTIPKSQEEAHLKENTEGQTQSSSISMCNHETKGQSMDIITKDDESHTQVTMMTKPVDAVLYLHKKTYRPLLVIKFILEEDLNKPTFWVIARTLQSQNNQKPNECIVCKHGEDRKYNERMKELIDEAHNAYNNEESVIKDEDLGSFISIFVHELKDDITFEIIEDYDDDHRYEYEKNDYNQEESNGLCKRKK